MGSIKKKKEKKGIRAKAKAEKKAQTVNDPLAGSSTIGFDLNYTSGYQMSFNNSEE
jgi:hypothetical protein